MKWIFGLIMRLFLNLFVAMEFPETITVLFLTVLLLDGLFYCSCIDLQVSYFWLSMFWLVKCKENFLLWPRVWCWLLPLPSWLLQFVCARGILSCRVLVHSFSSSKITSDFTQKESHLLRLSKTEKSMRCCVCLKADFGTGIDYLIKDNLRSHDFVRTGLCKEGLERGKWMEKWCTYKLKSNTIKNTNQILRESGREEERGSG